MDDGVTRNRADDAFTGQAMAELRAGLTAAAYDRDAGPLDDALRTICAEARRARIPAEGVVLALKRVWRGTTRPGLFGAGDWDAIYRLALARALDAYFDGRRQ